MRLSIVAGRAMASATYLGTRMFGLASPATFRTASLVLIALAVVTEPAAISAEGRHIAFRPPRAYIAANLGSLT